MIGLWIFISIFVIYVMSSIILLLFPTLLHKKKKQTFLAQHISHRGGAGERYENTMSAFDNAYALGTDMFEIDVQLTKDNKVVISHDNDLYRVTEVEDSISNLNFDDLPRLKSEVPVTFTKGAITSTGDRNITLLSSVLEKYPNVPLNIDTKFNNAVIDPLLELIYRYKRQHNVVMANMGSEAINIIHKKDPDLLLGTSIKRTAIMVLLFWTGLLPFIPLKESFLQIPLPEMLLLNKNLPVSPRVVRVLQALLMSRVFFRHLQKRGMQVHLFVVNDEELFKICFNKYKVDGVMTDYPGKLRDYLKGDGGDSAEPLLSRNVAES